MIPRILDFLKSPPGMMLLLVVAVLIAFYFIGEERSRAELPTAPPVLPTSDFLATSELSTPKTVDRRNAYKPFIAPPKKVEIPPVQPSPTVIEPEPLIQKAALPVSQKKPVLIHAFVAPQSTAPFPLVQANPSPKNPLAQESIQFPYGTLIPCRLIHSVVAGEGRSPIMAVVTEDVHVGGRFTIREGLRVHGTTAEIFRARLAASPQWHFTLNGKPATVNATIIDRSVDPTTGRFSFGAAGIAGKRLDKPGKHTGRIFLATAISAVGRALKDTSSGFFGPVPNYSLKNAGIEGGSAVADRHADRLLEKTRNVKPILSVPAGTEFYLYTIESSPLKIDAVQSPELLNR